MSCLHAEAQWRQERCRACTPKLNDVWSEGVTSSVTASIYARGGGWKCRAPRFPRRTEEPAMPKRTEAKDEGGYFVLSAIGRESTALNV